MDTRGGDGKVNLQVETIDLDAFENAVVCSVVTGGVGRD